MARGAPRGVSNQPAEDADASPQPAPRVANAFSALALLSAVVLPFVAAPWGLEQTKNWLPGTLLALVVLSLAYTEIGRALEGDALAASPHRAPTAWALCAALLLPLPYVLVVVTVSYLHGSLRGMWPRPRACLDSAAVSTIAAVGAGVTARAIKGADPNWMFGDGGRGLAALLVATAVFLAVETALLHAGARLTGDRSSMRRIPSRTSFYLTEACMLLIGALSAAVWTGGSWFWLLLFPLCALAQRAMLHEPLRERADTDDKTGLLRFESWRALALAEQQRCVAKSRAYSLAFADLDQFKAYNDAHGHIAGDAVLALLAQVLRAQLRSRDLVGRFGGEEFCFFLPDTPAEEAERVAERMRESVASCELPLAGTSVTISVGVVTVAGHEDAPQFVELLAAADRALFQAKRTGRNRVWSGDPGRQAEQAPGFPPRVLGKSDA